MTAIDAPPTALDAELAARLERLAARNTSRESSGPAMTKGRAKRRHPARKSRIAALVLSLVSTGGLTAGFAAIDGPSSSVVTAQGGIIDDVGTRAASAPATPAIVNDASAPAAPAIVNGDVFSNKWGPVQVQATFATDGSLVSVDAIQVPVADRKSVRINDRAVPVLNSEALTSQAAQVDTVSGATYTSNDYERSLQSAIDEARVAGITQLL